MNDQVWNTYLSGMVTAGFMACGLFFARFWWRSRDLLFLAFAAAFWLLALNTALVVVVTGSDENKSWFYLLRVAAYVLIAIAVIRKNSEDPEED
ncbi:MAG TPA: DUF5985 family protein [Acetobacteraceae bacterium]|nr:DUF5985 family protein [Acetobacteraceae bacterium]